MIDSKDIDKILRVVGVPLGAFGLELLKKKTSRNELELRSIYKEVEQLKHDTKDIHIDKDKLAQILHIFNAAIETVNEKDDMHTMTGYSLEEIYETKNKLIDLTS